MTQEQPLPADVVERINEAAFTATTRLYHPVEWLIHAANLGLHDFMREFLEYYLSALPQRPVDVEAAALEMQKVAGGDKAHIAYRTAYFLPLAKACAKTWGLTPAPTGKQGGG